MHRCFFCWGVLAIFVATSSAIAHPSQTVSNHVKPRVQNKKARRLLAKKIVSLWFSYNTPKVRKALAKKGQQLSSQGAKTSLREGTFSPTKRVEVLNRPHDDVYMLTMNHEGPKSLLITPKGVAVSEFNHQDVWVGDMIGRPTRTMDGEQHTRKILTRFGALRLVEKALKDGRGPSFEEVQAGFERSATKLGIASVK